MLRLFAALCVGCSILTVVPAAQAADIIFNPPGDGAPTGTRGGASRGLLKCMKNGADKMKYIVPLTPGNAKYNGLTLSGHPRMFVYIPAATTEKAYFSIKDENDSTVYEVTLTIPAGGGVVQLALPTTEPPLAIGKRYVWGLAVLCSGKLEPDSPFVSSWIQRVAPSATLATTLQKASLVEQAALYGSNGFWYDTLAALAEARRQQPTNSSLTANWAGLLHAVGLDPITAAPLSGKAEQLAASF